MHQVCSRFPDEAIDQVDRYMRERERSTRAPFSRSLVVLEIVEDWAHRRVLLIETARRLLGAEAATKLDGKTDDEVRRAIITVVDGAARLTSADGSPRSADYVFAYFDAMISRPRGSDEASAQATLMNPNGTVQSIDGIVGPSAQPDS